MDKPRNRKRAAAGLDPLVSLPTGDQAFELVDDGPLWAAVRGQLFAGAGDREIEPEDWDEILRAAQIMDTPAAQLLWPAASQVVARILDTYRQPSARGGRQLGGPIAQGSEETAAESQP